MSKTWYGHHIDTIKGEDYVLFKDYLELDKEIERLKAREQECIDKYLAESKYRSEIEGKYVVDEYIINELEKWLEEKQTFYGINQQGFSWGVCGEALDKLRELKEGKDNEK